MRKIIGIKTKKVYAEGTRSECMRTLSEKYPNHSKNVSSNQVLPEPMRFIGKYEKWEEEE